MRSPPPASPFPPLLHSSALTFLLAVPLTPLTVRQAIVIRGAGRRPQRSSIPVTSHKAVTQRLSQQQQQQGLQRLSPVRRLNRPTVHVTKGHTASSIHTSHLVRESPPLPSAQQPCPLPLTPPPPPTHTHTHKQKAPLPPPHTHTDSPAQPQHQPSAHPGQVG